MKISGHKTDSMERRDNIVDTEDLIIAKELLERRMNRARPKIAPERPANDGDGSEPEKDSFEP